MNPALTTWSIKPILYAVSRKDGAVLLETLSEHPQGAKERFMRLFGFSPTGDISVKPVHVDHDGTPKDNDEGNT